MPRKKENTPQGYEEKAEESQEMNIGLNKSELIQKMTEKQKEETLLIVSGGKTTTPTTKRVRQFFEGEAQTAGLRMVELSKQDKNLNVAFNATKEILEISGVTREQEKDKDLLPIGEAEATLILRRRIKLENII
jgi:hypothetical protein